MFSLAKQAAKLTSFNARSENNGPDEKVPAFDLGFVANIAATDVLPMFDPTLRSCLYFKRDDDPDMANKASRADETPNIRFPKMGPIKWAYELVGASVTVHRGINERGDIAIDGCKVNGFVLDPQEGGTVILSWRVQCKLDEKQSGKLSQLVQQSVDVSLAPPESGDTTTMPPAAG